MISNMQGTSVERFPNSDAIRQQWEENPAINVFGRRFLSAQTVLEYLAEFLLVFSSEKHFNKSENRGYKNDIPIQPKFNFIEIAYFPPSRLPLKLFTFFTMSQLEKRHPVHRKTFEDSLKQTEGKVLGNPQDKEKTVKALQAVLSGFSGVSGNRGWPAHVFLPVSESLLAREIIWGHSKAIKSNISEWKDFFRSGFFRMNLYNFMARGGELLYLQLLNLFNNFDSTMLNFRNSSEYAHIKNISVQELKNDICSGLDEMLNELKMSIGKIVEFIENCIGKDLEDNDYLDSQAKCGWVPAETLPESLLFAWEMRNILKAEIDIIQKVELLEILCSMQVLRTLCFQAARNSEAYRNRKTEKFIGNYVWTVSHKEENIKKLSAYNYKQIEKLIFSAVEQANTYGVEIKNKIAESGHLLFRKLSKDLEIAIPRKGPGARFVLNENIIRFLVLSLVPPDSRMRFNRFIERAFLHYGMAISPDELSIASGWTMPDSPEKTGWSEPEWLMEKLNAGGFLIQLSDAVSIVKNPFHKIEDNLEGAK